MSRRQPLSLRTNFSWTVAGNAVYALCKWLNLLVLTKLAPLEEVGTYALALAIAAPIMLLTDLQLRTVQATDANRDYAFRDYVRLRAGGIVIGGSTIVFVAVLLYRGSPTLAVLAGMAAVKSAESIGDVFYGLFQQRERMDLVARSLVAKGVLSTFGFAVAFTTTHSLLIAILAQAAGYFLVFATFDVPNGWSFAKAAAAESASETSQRIARLFELFKLALPLGAVTMLASLYVNIPRYAVEHFEGTAALGIFSALAYVVMLGSLFVSSLSQAVSARLATYFAEGAFDAFRSLLLRLLCGVALLGIGGVAVALLFGEALLSRLYNDVYGMESELFVWLMVAAALSFCGSVLGTAVSAMRRFRAQAVVHGLNVVLISALSFLLVERYGLHGAAWAMLGSTSCMVAVYLGLTIHTFRAAARPASA